ncbi:MAG TPA: AAA family ATPase, partial [Thermodesulfovibrionales bacterium]|nr:AAA family ATPase [Thermodesulfovibrionales bacterium]
MKYVFPQLRALCESRGVVWGEVDLRWGITDEEKAEGKVLPLCLEEINNCRPYFIGLLGERYGWVPDEIPAEIIEREPWLKDHLKHSVTELEILQGVFRNPEMADHAFFYFRDPFYVERLPEKQRKDFIEEDTQQIEKLHSLKNRIRGSRFPVRENYPDPKALGELVLKDMTSVINKLFPEGSAPNPLDRDALEHEQFAKSRAAVYIGRKEYFDRLDEHARRNEQPLAVLGESGSGKSALLSTWALKYKEMHPDELVIMHFIGAAPYSADWMAMLRRIMGEIKRQFDIRDEIPDKSEELKVAFANWLHMAAAKGKVVLILDALNQLEDRDAAPDLVWLPPFIPDKIRLIVSTLPGKPLDEIDRRGWKTLRVEPLVGVEKKKLTTEYLQQYSKKLTDEQQEVLANAPQTANPLYLRALLE